MPTFFQAPVHPLLIRDVRVFDGEHVLEQRSVLVEDGTIIRVTGPGLHVAQAEVVDGRNRTLLPGLFDAHVHLAAHPEPALHQAISLGITTVLDMFNGIDLLKAKQRLVAEEPADLADLRTAGFGAIAPGSLLATLFSEPLPTISDPEEAPSWVDARLAEGSDYIKIVYDEREGGDLSQEVVRALVQAAHRRGKLVVVHVLAEQQAREAMAAGADGLGHLFLGEDASLDLGQFAAAHHVFVIPTLMILAGLCGRPQAPALLADSHLAPYLTAQQRLAQIRPADPGRRHLYQATLSAMHQLLEAQVPLLAGTDTGPPAAAFGVTGYGAALHGELKLLVEAGMAPAQALAAATSVPAHFFHLTDRGLIRPGMRADLVLVEGNPTQDILATRNIVAVWKRGVQIQRERGETADQGENPKGKRQMRDHLAPVPLDGTNRPGFDPLGERGSARTQLPRESFHHVHLVEEKETLLITLYAKALDNRSKRPILGDKAADEVVSSLAHDFHKLKGVGNDPLSVLRAKQFDDWIEEFLAQHHEATVLHLGCGLDTRVMRVNPPARVKWYDLDYPEVIALREQCFPKRDEYFLVASSVTDQAWLETIQSDRPVMIVAEGLLEYLAEQEVRTLLNRLTSHFRHGQIAFDVLNSFAIQLGKSKLQETTGAAHTWAVDDTRSVEQLDPKLRKLAELSVTEVASLKQLPWRLRLMYTGMRVIPRFRNMLRLLRYEF